MNAAPPPAPEPVVRAAELHALARQLRDSATRVADILCAGDQGLSPEEAAQFRDWWTSQHGPAVMHAAAALEELSHALRRGNAPSDPREGSTA